MRQARAGVELPAGRTNRHALRAFSQAADFREIQSLISASDWKPSICSTRPSGHVSSMYHALPSFSACGVIVGVDALIMGHYAPIPAQCKLDRIGGTALAGC